MIVCGEFNSGVQILSQSREKEEVFTITKITNHPKYNPKRVSQSSFCLKLLFSCALFNCFSYYQDGVGEGGPYEGNDISVYHVETDFVMEDIVEVNKSKNKSGNNSKRKNRRKKGKQAQDDEIDDNTTNGRSNSWIWPVCFPKDDTDPDFLVDNGIVRQWNEKGMIAGWLDAPPIDQTFSKILGSAVSEGDVFR